MPSSSVRTFTEPDEYALAMRQGTVGLTVKQRGSFSAKLTRIDLHSLWMQRLSEDLARTSHVDGLSRARATVVFRTQPGSSVIRNGVELGLTTMARIGSGQGYYTHTSGHVSYGGMSLPLEKMADLGATVGLDLTPPNDDLTVTPSPNAMGRLQQLHAAAGVLAEDAPAVLEHPEAARGLEQALIEAMIDCLGGGEIEQDRTAQRQHAAIMRRFHRVIEENLNEPLFITELCKEVGASERTLNTCCHEHLGMGPKHYLLLRRMQMARRALHEGAPGTTTVTEAATRYGFWQFGRFAVEYKALFGEAPSATLARPV